MSDQNEAKNNVGQTDDLSIKQAKKFSLIELLMIIMLVGIVVTFIFPLRQMKIDRSRTQEAIEIVREIAKIDEDFKNNPDLGDGEYAFDFSQLNYKPDNAYFTFRVADVDMEGRSITGGFIVATTTEEFGHEGIQIKYMLPSGPWSIEAPDKAKDVIHRNWLP